MAEVRAPGGPPVADEAPLAYARDFEPLSDAVVRNVFFNDASVAAHDGVAASNPAGYEAAVLDLVTRRLYQSSFSMATKAHILAVSVRRRLRSTERLLLGPASLVGVAEVLRAVTILDAPRLVRQLEAKARRMEEAGARPARVAHVRTLKHNAERDMLEGGSVSGATAKRLRRWLGSLPRERLEFFLVNFPQGPWRRLLDIIHARPSDFALECFQPVLYGASAPEDSVVALAAGVGPDNVGEALRTRPQLADCYSFLRRRLSEDPAVAAALRREEVSRSLTALGFSRGAAYAALAAAGNDLNRAAEWIMEHPDREEAGLPDNPEAVLRRPEDRATVARGAPLEDALWFYEELHCAEAEEAIRARLAAGEAVDQVRDRSGYAKMMERLLLFRERGLSFAPLLVPVAEGRLRDLVLSNARPGAYMPRVAVLGDASGSMGVAVRTATVVASLLSVALRAADLLFFADSAWKPGVPSSVEDVLRVVEATRAEGGTCMASALQPLLRERRAVDLVVLVSDEGENQPGDDGRTFAETFAAYRREVAPSCRVFLVSFLRVGEEGLVLQRLRAEGIEAQQFRLDPERPDTSKFDALLGHVQMQTSESALVWSRVRDVLAGVSDLASLVTSY